MLCLHMQGCQCIIVTAALQVAIVAQNGQPDVEQGSNGAAAKRLTSNSSSRRPPPPTVPAEVKQAVAIFKPCFDPIFFPRVSLPA